MHIESQFETDQLIRVIIPKATIDLLKLQKGSAGGSFKKNKGKSPLLAQDSNFNAQQCQYYSFQLVCKDKTSEYVVEGYLPFKYITAAFEDLIAQRESIERINSKIFIFEESPATHQGALEE